MATFNDGNFLYTITSSTEVSVAKINSSTPSGSAIIPSTVVNGITTYTVISIGDNAFVACSALTAITFAPISSVASIGSYAFGSCPNLASITIPNSVTSIGDSAFQNCTALETVIFDTNSNVTTIGVSAFENCTSLISITIPGYVMSIGDSAFRECNKLASVNFVPNYNMTSIGNNAFYNCGALTSITIPPLVASIGNNTFRNCSLLESITFSPISSVTSIGEAAFYNCSALASITIPPGVTSIGGSAFTNCAALTSINIPPGVTSIGANAFAFCSLLETIIFDPLSSITTIFSYAFDGCGSLKSINIPPGVTSIRDSTFFNCYALTSITIPPSVTSIGASAFKNCSALENIYFYGNIPTLGTDCFLGTASTNTAYYMNSATDTTTLTPLFSNVVQLKYISENGGIALNNITATTATIKWNQVQNIIKGSFTGTLKYTITLNSSSTLFRADNIESFTFTNLQPTTSYQYTVSYEINPFLEIVSDSFNTNGMISTICFIGSTLIHCDQGYMKIKDINTKKHTIQGNKILAITKTSFAGKSLIKIEKDALGMNVPNRDTIMTEQHCIAYKNRLIESHKMLGEKITRVAYQGEIMYNILMESHKIILAHNMPVETLHPDNLIAKIYRDFNYGDLTPLRKLVIIKKVNTVMKKKMEALKNTQRMFQIV